MAKIRNYNERGFSLRRPCILPFITQSIPGIFHLEFQRVYTLLAPPPPSPCIFSPPLAALPPSPPSHQSVRCKLLEDFLLFSTPRLSGDILKNFEEVPVFWNKCAFIAEKAGTEKGKNVDLWIKVEVM